MCFQTRPSDPNPQCLARQRLRTGCSQEQACNICLSCAWNVRAIFLMVAAMCHHGRVEVYLTGL